MQCRLSAGLKQVALIDCDEAKVSRRDWKKTKVIAKERKVIPVHHGS